MLSFLFFTDMGIYWIHRGLHHRLFYKVGDLLGGLWQLAVNQGIDTAWGMGMSGPGTCTFPHLHPH